MYSGGGDEQGWTCNGGGDNWWGVTALSMDRRAAVFILLVQGEWQE